MRRKHCFSITFKCSSLCAIFKLVMASLLILGWSLAKFDFSVQRVNKTYR